jgi:ferric-dicitrate binding protein FerR (iron transport regulator)
MNQSYWKDQLNKYRMGSLSSAEEELLWDALADAANAEGWKEIMEEIFREQAQDGKYQISDWEPVIQAVFHSDKTVQPSVVRRVPTIFRYAVAAVVFALLGTGAWWVSHDAQGMKSLDVSAPVTNRAMITLGNGQKVYLDSVVNGALAQQGNAELVKEGSGRVAYKVENVTNRELLYNTLTNPRGSRVVSLTLSDGTNVWLNSESSLRYPVIFSGHDRTVEIKGEEYFEVKKIADQPFIVQVEKGAKIEVLGTTFNVNAYPDELTIKTTLLDGSVRVAGVVLKPGQQAWLAGQKIVLNKVDTSDVVAWKNGLFAFHDADLPSVMRQLARWYNIEVTYEGLIPREKFQFNGKMGKDLSLDNVLDLLTNAQVHFRIEAGNKLVIRP